MQTTLDSSQALFTAHLQSQGKARATVVAYSKDIEQLIGFVAKQGKHLLTDVGVEEIEAFKALLKKQRYSGKSISRKVNSIKAYFRFLLSEGLVETNPADVVAHPKYEQTLPRVLSRTEYRALRDTCRGDVRMAAVVEILLQTGMRISELAELKIADVDLERNILTINAQSNKPSRRVPLNMSAKAVLTSYLQMRPRARERTLFLTKTCRPFLVRNIRTAVDRYFRLAGIKGAKLNDLRHTFVVEQLKAGTPLVYISQLVGHKSITTTEKYLKLLDTPDIRPSIQIEEL